MNDEILTPAGIKCRHCDQYTHTLEDGRKCQDKEYLSVIVENDKLRHEVHLLRTTLKGLSERHEWQPMVGQCVCDWHNKARALITDWQEYIPTGLNSEPNPKGFWRRVGNTLEIKKAKE